VVRPANRCERRHSGADLDHAHFILRGLTHLPPCNVSWW
jgi:hypothetical protein